LLGIVVVCEFAKQNFGRFFRCWLLFDAILLSTKGPRRGHLFVGVTITVCDIVVTWTVGAVKLEATAA